MAAVKSDNVAYLWNSWCMWAADPENLRGHRSRLSNLYFVLIRIKCHIYHNAIRYNLTTPCLSVTLPCTDFMDVIMGDIPACVATARIVSAVFFNLGGLKPHLHSSMMETHSSVFDVLQHHVLRSLVVERLTKPLCPLSISAPTPPPLMSRFRPYLIVRFTRSPSIKYQN